VSPAGYSGGHFDAFIFLPFRDDAISDFGVREEAADPMLVMRNTAYPISLGERQ